MTRGGFLEMGRRTFALAATTAAVLMVPATAGAAIKQVFMGSPPSAGKALEKAQSEVNAFFPRTVAVRVGDSVRFRPVGFHNVDLPPRGGKQTPLLAPTGQKADTPDAAGADFWFKGLDILGFNPKLLKSNFGRTLIVTGKRSLNSGLPLAPKPKPVTLRFTKAGTYTYFCDVHPGMKGTVRVVPKRKSVPSAAADARRVAQQVTRAIATAKGLRDKTAGAKTVRIGVAGAGGVERFAFAPFALSVKPGETVKFEMWPGSREAHTATAGPGDPQKQADSYLGKLAASFQSPALSPLATYPSERPGSAPAQLSPSLHGNGFWNTGVLDTVPGSPLPADNSVTFATAGTYAFYCLIHPVMKATVTVG